MTKRQLYAVEIYEEGRWYRRSSFLELGEAMEAFNDQMKAVRWEETTRGVWRALESRLIDSVHHPNEIPSLRVRLWDIPNRRVIARFNFEWKGILAEAPALAEAA